MTTIPDSHNSTCGTCLKEAKEVARRRAPLGVLLAAPARGARAAPPANIPKAPEDTGDAAELVSSEAVDSESEIIADL